MQKKILSIIIPTYNMSMYLKHCLDSLLIEDEQLLDTVEVIVVNDGSTDDSSYIAHKYQDKYPHLFNVIDKDNGNYGSCVNRGLDVANGKYVKILDSDDSFDIIQFSEFVKKIQTVDVDLILSDFSIVDEFGNLTKKVTYEDIKDDSILDLESCLNKKSFKRMQMHAVTYKLDVLKQMNYKQTEGIAYTDQEWIFKPLLYVKTITYFQNNVYRYLVGRVGQTVEEDVQAKRIDQFMVMVESIIRFYSINKANMLKSLTEYYEHRIMVNIGFIYRTCVVKRLFPINLLISFDEKLKSLNPEIYSKSTSIVLHRLFRYAYVRNFRKNYKVSPLYIYFIFNFLKKISK